MTSATWIISDIIPNKLLIVINKERFQAQTFLANGTD